MTKTKLVKTLDNIYHDFVHVVSTNFRQHPNIFKTELAGMFIVDFVKAVMERNAHNVDTDNIDGVLLSDFGNYNPRKKYYLKPEFNFGLFDDSIRFQVQFHFEEN